LRAQLSYHEAFIRAITNIHVILLRNFGVVAGGLTGNILDREVAERHGNRRHTLRLHDPKISRTPSALQAGDSATTRLKIERKVVLLC